MTRITCNRARAHLAQFIDGEMRGPDVLLVGQHVGSCAPCADEAQALRDLGDQLRSASAAIAVPLDDLAGLADGVISRVHAEEQQSWTAKLTRGLDDLHWVLAGAGAVVAAVVSALIVAMVMATSTPERGDSLAALMQVSNRSDVVLASDSAGAQSWANLGQAMFELYGENASGENAMFVTSDGRVSDMDRFPKASRKDIETYLSELSRFQVGVTGTSGLPVPGWLITRVRVKAS